jgi:primosomal protein N' (replication factor Y)
MGFVRRELPARREHGVPPHGRLVAVRVDAVDEAHARAVAVELGRVASAHAAVRAARVDVLGPAEAPIARLRGRYRQRLLLRSSDRPQLRAVASAVLERIEQGLGAARASVDVDPVSML